MRQKALNWSAVLWSVHFLLCKPRDSFAFRWWWEILPSRNVSLTSSGNAQYPGDASCLTFCFSSDYSAFAQMREVILLSLMSSSTCNYVTARLFPLCFRLHWLTIINIQGFVLPAPVWVTGLSCFVVGIAWVSGIPSSVMGCPSLLPWVFSLGIWGQEPADLSENKSSIHGIRCE